MKVRITKAGVTDHGSLLEVNAVIEIDDKNGASLIVGDYAEAVEEDEHVEPTANDMAKTLDKKYKADELKAAATAVGVEFAEGANKGDVVVAIIAAGKYADLMA